MDWSRPSTLLLIIVIGLNLMAPVVHFWPGSADASTQRRAAPQQSAAAGADPPVAATPTLPITPVVAPPLTKRVAMREPVPVCRAWGPFAELGEAEALASRLHLDSDNFEVFESQVQDDPDFLVTVRTAGGREAVNGTLSELERQGFDSYVLERGRDGAVLAVGVFSVTERAERQRGRLAALGYQAAVQALPRSHPVYHLMARIPADSEPEVPFLAACNDIAPMQQFL